MVDVITLHVENDGQSGAALGVAGDREVRERVVAGDLVQRQ